jgi:hypothetical protein
VHPRSFAILFAFGGALLSMCDAFHTHSGTTAYAHVWALGMAWWTFPLFGGFVAAAGSAYASLHESRAAPAHVALSVVGFVALYVASAWLPGTNALKLAVLAAGAALLWWAIDRSRRGALLAIGVAAIGTCGEASLISIGAFWYARPDFLGVPMWLPALYAAGATALGHVAVAVTRP